LLDARIRSGILGLFIMLISLLKYHLYRLARSGESVMPIARPHFSFRGLRLAKSQAQLVLGLGQVRLLSRKCCI
jgi:hypothetical protein